MCCIGCDGHAQLRRGGGGAHGLRIRATGVRGGVPTNADGQLVGVCSLTVTDSSLCLCVAPLRGSLVSLVSAGRDDPLGGDRHGDPQRRQGHREERSGAACTHTIQRNTHTQVRMQWREDQQQKEEERESMMHATTDIGLRHGSQSPIRAAHPLLQIESN